MLGRPSKTDYKGLMTDLRNHIDEVVTDLPLIRSSDIRKAVTR